MDINIYALICTRSKDLSPTAQKLVSYLSRANIKVKLIVGAKSIYSGYSRTVKKINPNPNDIIILCHDDIEIISSPESFKEVLISETLKQDTGFIGVAGTTKLSESGVWWDQRLWKLEVNIKNQQYDTYDSPHRGFVLHGKDIKTSASTYYGVYGRVVVLDGLFLAATAKTIEKVGLDKPSYFEGEWDFYDIHYTYSAHKQKLKNKTVPIFILHNSLGELAGRDSWHKNRLAFINQNKTKFPIIC